MKVFLLGYMACGKSTIGKVLAKNIKLKFVDLDNFIEEQEENTISEIFEAQGEIKFRKLERFYLEKLVNSNEDMVVSLGGGTPCYYDSIDYINESNNANTFYLRTQLNVLVERLKLEKDTRPVVKRFNDDELFEFIGKHLFERSYYYNKAQHIINNETIDDTVSQIQSYLS